MGNSLALLTELILPVADIVCASNASRRVHHATKQNHQRWCVQKCADALFYIRSIEHDPTCLKLGFEWLLMLQL